MFPVSQLHEYNYKNESNESEHYAQRLYDLVGQLDFVVGKKCTNW